MGCSTSKDDNPKQLLEVVPKVDDWHNFRGDELEPLLECTSVVCLRWLIRFARGEVRPAARGGELPIVPASQTLPPEALASLQRMRLYRNGVMTKGLPVIVLSYPWADKEHPDRSGQLLRRLLPVLEALAAHCDHYGGAEATWGIVWDFIALPQRGHTDPSAAGEDRTPEQLARFRKGLSQINCWYGHPYTVVLVVDLPLPPEATNAAPHERRGW